MLAYPMYYHDKNQEVWLTLTPRCYEKYAKRADRPDITVLVDWV